LDDLDWPLKRGVGCRVIEEVGVTVSKHQGEKKGAVIKSQVYIIIHIYVYIYIYNYRNMYINADKSTLKWALLVNPSANAECQVLGSYPSPFHELPAPSRFTTTISLLDSDVILGI